MSVDVFLDTNVFVYHLDTTDPRKHDVAERLVSSALLHGGACISFQVVQECLNTARRKAEVKLDVEVSRQAQVAEEAGIQGRLEKLRDDVALVSRREREAQDVYRARKEELESMNAA